MLLFERIKNTLRQKSPLRIEWPCEPCGGTHEGNLLKRASDVAMEHDLGRCRPDLALLNLAGQVVAGIEIVVTHHPEQYALDFYKQHSIPLVIFELESDTDISRVHDPILMPDKVDVCMNPRCGRCGHHMQEKRIAIITGECQACYGPMKTAALLGSKGYPGELTKDDIKIARNYGVLPKYINSRKYKTLYLAFLCGRCGSAAGRLGDFSDSVAIQEDSRVEIKAGYYCLFCMYES
jgi:hypothetical protein